MEGAGDGNEDNEKLRHWCIPVRWKDNFYVFKDDYLF